MSHQTDLLALFAQTQGVLDDFLASRSEEERAARGTPQTWAAKDLLALIGFWMTYNVDRLNIYAKGDIPPSQVDFSALNRAAFEANAGLAWDEVAHTTQEALAALAQAVQRSSDELLTTINRYEDIPDDLVWEEVRANGFIWPLQELEKYYLRAGEMERAAAVRALLVPVVGEPEVISCDLIAPQALADLPGEPLVIDVRGASEYAAGHLPTARHIPLAELTNRLSELPQGRPIVTYCNMNHPGQSRSERAAALLHEQGYQSWALVGGYPAWQEQGYAIEIGKEAKSSER
jgi:rhodanese-related sulfurtransferase